MSFFIPSGEEDVARERQKARDLRKTRWWKEKIGQRKCEYCGKSFETAELTMDHIVPLARGGKTVKNNIVAACKECNNKKKYMLPMEWEEYLKNK